MGKIASKYAYPEINSPNLRKKVSLTMGGAYGKIIL